MEAVTEIFSGIRVLELAQYVFVPGAGALLADFGAEVIKVEDVSKGDAYRTLSVGDGRENAAVNVALEQNNRGKRSLSINLKSPEGMAAFHKLIATADVFLTNFRPNALTRLKLDVEDVRRINPKIIYARGNGLGYKGDEKHRAGYDATSFWSRGGFASSLTQKDFPRSVKSRGALGDHTGSLSVAFGIATALFRRERTGVPSVVEASLFTTALWVLSSDVSIAHLPSFTENALFERMVRFPLFQTHKTKDGRYIQLNLLNPDRYWVDLCRTLELDELAEDPRFAKNAQRIENGLECGRIVSERIAERTWAEWKPRFHDFDAPWELAQTVLEAQQDPQAKAMEAIVELTSLDGSTTRLVSGPVQFDEEGAKSYRRAPKLGEDTIDLLKGLGMTDAEIADLAARQVVRAADA